MKALFFFFAKKKENKNDHLSVVIEQYDSLPLQYDWYLFFVEGEKNFGKFQ